MRSALTFFLKADKLLDRAWRWGTAFVASWAGLAWIAKRMTRLGDLNWADAVAVGFVAAIVLLLAFSCVLFAANRRPREPRSPRNMGDTAPTADESITASLQALAGRIHGLESKPHQPGETAGLLLARRQHLEGQVALIEKVEREVEAAWKGFSAAANLEPSRVYEIASERLDRAQGGPDIIHSFSMVAPFIDQRSGKAAPPFDPARRVLGDAAFEGDHKAAYRRRHYSWERDRQRLAREKGARLEQVRSCNLAIEAIGKAEQEAKESARG